MKAVRACPPIYLCALLRIKRCLHIPSHMLNKAVTCALGSLKKVSFSSRHSDLFPSDFWGFLPLSSPVSFACGLYGYLAWRFLKFSLQLIKIMVFLLSLKKQLSNQLYEITQKADRAQDTHVSAKPWSWGAVVREKTEIAGTEPERCVNVGCPTKLKKSSSFFFFCK